MQDSRVSVKPKVFPVIVTTFHALNDGRLTYSSDIVRFKNQDVFLDALLEFYPSDGDYVEERQEILQALKERDSVLLNFVYCCVYLEVGALTTGSVGIADHSVVSTFFKHGRKKRPEGYRMGIRIGCHNNPNDPIRARGQA